MASAKVHSQDALPILRQFVAEIGRILRTVGGGAPVSELPVDSRLQAAVVAAGSLGRGRRVLVRWTLQELAALYPGRSVEVRVPPFGATQIIAGSTHRRGTPPAVVECDTPTWCALATGLVTWEEAVLCGKVLASGQHTDLQERLPVGTLPRTCLF